MTTPERHPIFVYGSLRPGEFFYPRVKPYVEKIESAKLYGMQLYSLGPYPGMVFDEKADRPVIGDLLHIYEEQWPTAIQVLDRIEAEGEFYDRRQIIVMCGEEPRIAWAYLLKNEQSSIPKFDKVLSNDWKVERAKHADLRKTDFAIKPVSNFTLLGATVKKATKLL